MFRVSRRVDYGLRLLIALASNSDAGPQSTANLAEKLDIPLAFLHQIGRSLIQAGILKASPGPGGGLRLNRSPESITLRQVLEVLEGPIRLNGEEAGEIPCSTQVVWEKVQAQLVSELDGIHLNGLAESAQGKGGHSFYSLP
ncbi:MAG TPA: Rrf2 family transcriptional regulator, partial [Anaerolineaceae bacterium]|nr:Rrf2 family transcriptional regulator [Anaerolineaceae bacterium]